MYFLNYCVDPKEHRNLIKRRKHKGSVQGKRNKRLRTSSNQESGNKESGDSSKNWNIMMNEFKKTLSEAQNSQSYLENQKEMVVRINNCNIV